MRPLMHVSTGLIFAIRYLDWNKADLCVDTIRKKAPNVAHIWLHSSGSNAGKFSSCISFSSSVLEHENSHFDSALVLV